MDFLKLIGEAAMGMQNNLVRSFDGSFVAIQTDKGAYYAGDTMMGFVVAQLNSPRQVDRVLVRVTCTEETMWDQEIARSHTEGEGDKKRTVTVYEHREHFGREAVLSALVVVSAQPMLLGAGQYKYPFSFTFDRALPGCARYSRTTNASDPHWQREGRQLRARGEIVYRLEAVYDIAGVFAADLTCSQMLTVNQFFDWSKMQPLRAEASGEVRLCCCIPRGAVTLSCDFDKSAYAAGETVQVRARIRNDSKENVKAMKVKLVRFISLRDNAGQSHEISDVVARATYPGVEKLSAAERDLPLPLRNDNGALLPGTSGRKFGCRYEFAVDCDLFCAPDIRVAMRPNIYSPAPATWGRAALGVAVPAGMDLSFGAGGFVPQQQVMVAPVGVMQQQMQQYQQQQQPGSPMAPGYQQPGSPMAHQPSMSQQQLQQQMQPQQYQQQPMMGQQQPMGMPMGMPMGAGAMPMGQAQ